MIGALSTLSIKTVALSQMHSVCVYIQDLFFFLLLLISPNMLKIDPF